MQVDVNSSAADTLRSRVSHFITDPVRSNSPFSRVRTDVQLVVSRILTHNWEAVIFGGILRDLMLRPSNWLPRDIDIVVSNVSNQELEMEFSDLLDRRTRFGGLHLRRNAMFDVWSLPSTWAIREFHLTETFSELPRTTFLNIEAVAIDLGSESGKPRSIYSHGFFESLTSRTLEINFEPNPYPELCVVRSLIMAAKLDFAIGARLAEYLIREASRASARALIDVQYQHYGAVRLTTEDLEYWLDCIKGEYGRRERITLPVSKERQRVLWNWPTLRDSSSLNGNRKLRGVARRRRLSSPQTGDGSGKLF